MRKSKTKRTSEVLNKAERPMLKAADTHMQFFLSEQCVFTAHFAPPCCSRCSVTPGSRAPCVKGRALARCAAVQEEHPVTSTS